MAAIVQIHVDLGCAGVRLRVGQRFPGDRRQFLDDRRAERPRCAADPHGHRGPAGRHRRVDQRGEPRLQRRRRAAGAQIADPLAPFEQDVVGVPRVVDGVSVWAQYTIRLPHADRDGFAARLKARGVPTAIYYPKSMHQQTAYKHYPVASGGLPVSERLSADVISLPMHAYLDEPIEDCLATDVDGRPCVEVRTPQDIEAELGMPGGHIFHGDLSWPWAEEPEQEGTWGVETNLPNVLICGSGARRGGGVSGIGGHNAAHALLSKART